MAIRSRRTLGHRFLHHLARLGDELVLVVFAIGVERLLPVECRQPPREPRQLSMALDASTLHGLNRKERDTVVGALARSFSGCSRRRGEGG